MTDHPNARSAVVPPPEYYIAYQRERYSRWQRGLSLVSILELVTAAALVVIPIVATLSTDYPGGTLASAIVYGTSRLLYNYTLYQIMWVVLFFETFCFLLTARTILVLIISTNTTMIRLTGAPHSPYEDLEGSSTVYLDKMNTDAQTPFSDSDIVTAAIKQYIVRSKEAARISQRRPNVLLFVGTFIAISGLIFFVLTIPPDIAISSALRATDLNPDFHLNPSVVDKTWDRLVELTPRLFMLIFIQVLAGFFLRQYRASMEDFRYFETILRYRESMYLSYEIRRSLKGDASMKQFAEILVEDREFGRMTKSQTTMALEAQRNETNEFTPMIERIIDSVSLKRGNERVRVNKTSSAKSNEKKSA